MIEEKDESSEEQTDPGRRFNSDRNMLKSPGAAQNTTTLPHLCNMKEKSEQQMDAEKHSRPKIMGDDFQQKNNLLSWSLPSLHSDSLITTWINHSRSILKSSIFLFKRNSSVCPTPMQEASSRLSQAQLNPQSPTSIPNSKSPQFHHRPQGQVQNQPHPPSLPILLPPPQPHTEDYGPSSSPSQNKSLSLPTEIEHSERSSRRKQVGRESPFPFTQEVYDTITPHQDLVDSITHENFPTNPKLQEKLEQHVQRWPIQRRRELPLETLEQMQLQDKLTSAYENHEPTPSQHFMSSNETKDVYDIEFPLTDMPSKNLGPILGKAPKGLSRDMETSQVDTHGLNFEASQRNLMKGLKTDLQKDLRKDLDKDLENKLKAHLSTKASQMNQGLIPLRVRRSGLAMNSGFSMTDTYVRKKSVTTSKSSQNSTSSSEQLAFLCPYTRQTLEEDIVRLKVRHRWGLLPKVLRTIKLFELKMAPSLPLTLCPQSLTLNTAEANSESEVVTFLEPSQTEEAVVDEPSSSLGSLPLVSSPLSKELEAFIGIPSGCHHGPSKILLNQLQSSQLSDIFTHIITDKSCQNTTIIETVTEKQETPLLPRKDIIKDTGAPSLGADIINKSQHKVGMSTIDQPQVYATDVLLPECSSGMSLAVNVSASSQAFDDLVVDGDNSLEKQKLSIVKHHDLLAGQKTTLASAYLNRKDKLNTAKYEESFKEPRTSKFTQIRKTEPTFGNKRHQFLPQNKRVTPENSLHRMWKRFLHWILPKKAIKGQGEPLKKSKLTLGIIQRQMKMKLPKDSDVAEAQQLVTAVGKMLEKKMMLQCKLPASNFNQHREGLLRSQSLGPPAAKGLPLSQGKGRLLVGGPIPPVRVISSKRIMPKSNNAVRI